MVFDHFFRVSETSKTVKKMKQSFHIAPKLLYIFSKLNENTTTNTVIAPIFLVWKFCARFDVFPQNSTPGN